MTLVDMSAFLRFDMFVIRAHKGSGIVSFLSASYKRWLLSRHRASVFIVARWGNWQQFSERDLPKGLENQVGRAHKCEPNFFLQKIQSSAYTDRAMRGLYPTPALRGSRSLARDGGIGGGAGRPDIIFFIIARNLISVANLIARGNVRGLKIHFNART